MGLRATHSGRLIPKLVYKSNDHNWHSPPQIVRAILKAYNLRQFACDPCTTDRNVPARLHYSEKDNGLIQPWPSEGHIWINPPYDRQLRKFVEKAVEHVRRNRRAVCWLLLPVRPANQYYQNLYKSGHAFTYLFEGKPEFLLDGKQSGPAPFGVQLTCLAQRIKQILGVFLIAKPERLAGSLYVPPGLISNKDFTELYRAIEESKKSWQGGGLIRELQLRISRNRSIQLDNFWVEPRPKEQPAIDKPEPTGYVSGMNKLMQALIKRRQEIEAEIRKRNKPLYDEMEKLNKAAAILGQGSPSKTGSNRGGKRKLSAEGRAAIAAAQKKRWANTKKTNKAIRKAARDIKKIGKS